ncbi:E3 ubiquitin-protein ligase RNF8-like protein [Leptotrombidium deliense]|uniref:E3 ubiquitin-protein ligase CHFR n=1 Tax=Leptotrombidium deliense TaxID=299467 RepID=A0A443SWQ7_9ACAR|nr:E3 ubiquitin-protein ligase RNF8-like protein [Leptotrombidium deliense]
MALLKNISKNGNSTKYCEFNIEEPQALIGRDTECDIRISNVEMSRRHARLSKINDKWQLIDLKSTNGVYVNGEKIKPSVPKPLSANDIISFGPPERTDFVYRFYLKVEEKKPKADAKKIKHLEKQIEEQSKSEELLKKKLKQHEREVKKKEAEIQKLTEKLKEAENLRHEEEIKRKNEELEKQRLKEMSEKQKKALKELKRKEAGRGVREVSGASKETSEIAASRQPDAAVSVSGQQVKRKYEDIFDSELTCPICSELFIEPVHVSCSHTFCNYCIELWKRNPNSHQECPVCRKPMKHVIREIVIENLIDKIVEEMDAQEKQRRVDVIEARKKKLEEFQSNLPVPLLPLIEESFSGNDSYDSDQESSVTFSDYTHSFASNVFAAFYNSTLLNDSYDTDEEDNDMDFSGDDDLDFNDDEDVLSEMGSEVYAMSEGDSFETANSSLTENSLEYSDDNLELATSDSSEDGHVSDGSDSSEEL